jgi:hypothetical protein
MPRYSMLPVLPVLPVRPASADSAKPAAPSSNRGLIAAIQLEEGGVGIWRLAQWPSTVFRRCAAAPTLSRTVQDK